MYRAGMGLARTAIFPLPGQSRGSSDETQTGIVSTKLTSRNRHGLVSPSCGVCQEKNGQIAPVGLDAIQSVFTATAGTSPW